MASIAVHTITSPISSKLAEPAENLDFVIETNHKKFEFEH